jgi:hypothetical protein
LLLWNLLFSVAFIPATPAQAALSTALVWEIRPTVGSDNNGGGFVAGATGTDFSQQDAAQYTFTNLASSNGSTNPCIVTSASHNFVASDVGNLLHVTAGTNWIPNFFQIVSVATNAATLDRACGTAASISGGTFAVGGALATISASIGATGRSASNKAFVKASGTAQIDTTITFLNPITPSRTVPPNQLIGYTSTRTDGGKATVQLITNTGLTAFDTSNAASTTGWYIRNFIIDCNGLGTSTGINLGDTSMVINSEIKNCKADGIILSATNFGAVIDTQVHGGTACTSGIRGSASNAITLLRNWVHDNACPGVIIPNRSMVVFNLITNNTGASSDGIQVGSSNVTILNNTIYGNGRDGIRDTGNSLGDSNNWRNNLLVNNVGFGINGNTTGAGWAAFPQYDGNAYFNNTGGARNNMDDTTTNPVNGVAPYTNTLDVTLTADPFVSAGTNNFTLNKTAGAGLAARGTGTPGVIQGNAQTGAIDLGSFQAAATGSQTSSAFAQ